MFTRLPIGAKLFLILSAALLPLAVIAVFASLQTGERANREAAARLRVAANEAARALSIELVGDMNAIRVSLDALARDPNDAPSCARLLGAFVSQQSKGARFRIVDRNGKWLCGDRTLPVSDPAGSPADDRIAASLVPDQGLLLSVGSGDSGARGTAFFPIEMLAQLARPDGYLPAYSARIKRGEQELVLQALPSLGPLDGRETARADIPLDDLELVMRIRSAPITSPLLVAMLLPLLMWAAAAGIGWLVVDLLLIRPLRRLRYAVSRYRPGEPLPPVAYGAMPAHEISSLDETFRDLTHTVQLHEADLATGLIRQTRLTREVHHRVKNNLQVIASLINLHARGASPDAADAYASIQRRVDALAVVHRHHYAELEEHEGLMLRSVIGELASNLRATAPAASARMGITLNVEQLLVSQDVAIALAFLITELIELAMQVDPVAQIGITAHIRENSQENALLRIASPALTDTPKCQALLAGSYGRVITGLSRQLRAPLHHDPLTGTYEIEFRARRAA